MYCERTTFGGNVVGNRTSIQGGEKVVVEFCEGIDKESMG